MYFLFPNTFTTFDNGVFERCVSHINVTMTITAHYRYPLYFKNLHQQKWLSTLLHVCTYMSCLTFEPGYVCTAQQNGTRLVGGFLSPADVQSQYLSAASDTFKSFVVDPESTKDKTDRYLRNMYIPKEYCNIYITYRFPRHIIFALVNQMLNYDKCINFK